MEIGRKKTLKVLFIYSDIFPNYPNWTGYFYAGVGILSSVVKQEGHETLLIHVTQEFSEREEFLGRIKASDPQLIAFSSTSLTFPYVRKMAGWLHHAQLKIPVISGGIHSTLVPYDVLEAPGIDMVCVGEGEVSFKKLVETLEEGKDFRKLPGIWVNDNGTIHKNGVSPMIRDLDQLPFPDRSIFDYPNLKQARAGKGVFLASRGCPYHCTYCSNRVLQQTYCQGQPGGYVRFRSVDNVIAEIKQVLENYPFIKTVHFDDDLFFLRKKWAVEFTEKYSTRVGLPLVCNMRPNHLNPEIAALLKKAGCVKVKVGVESGNEWIRNEVLKRNLSDRQIVDAFKYCRDLRIKTHSFNMVGIPYETSDTILDTIKMNAKIKSDLQQVSIFYPMPKTELYDLCREKGFTTDADGYDFFTPMLNIGTISKRRIGFLGKNFKILVVLYSKAFSLRPPLSKAMSSLLDTLLRTRFLDVIGILFSLLRKVRSVFSKRVARNKAKDS